MGYRNGTHFSEENDALQQNLENEIQKEVNNTKETWTDNLRD